MSSRSFALAREWLVCERVGLESAMAPALAASSSWVQRLLAREANSDVVRVTGVAEAEGDADSPNIGFERLIERNLILSEGGDEHAADDCLGIAPAAVIRKGEDTWVAGSSAPGSEPSHGDDTTAVEIARAKRQGFIECSIVPSFGTASVSKGSDRVRIRVGQVSNVR
jgi:hypothetical protein